MITGFRFSRHTRRLSLLLAWAVPAAGSAQGVDVGIFLLRDGRLAAVKRTAPAGQADAVAALEALAAGPSAGEQAAGYATALPAGTALASLVVEGAGATVDFSPGLLAGGMDEARLQTVFRQVQWTLRPFGLADDLRLTVEGRPLSDYLPPAKGAAVEGPPPVLTQGVQGRKITISPGHGYYWNGSGWHTQRPVYCAPLSEEDHHNLEMCQYLEYFLTAHGADARMARCTNKSFGNHSTGRPWWQMAAYLWIQQLGYPCSVYASSTGDCTTGSGASEYSDDIRSRPLMSDADAADIYISLHTNGFQGDCTGPGCPTGTETYYDASTEHAPWGPVSQQLANAVNPSILDAVNAAMPEISPDWGCHGTCVKNSNGAYGEIRIPDRAAILIELGFHDTCDRDALLLNDNLYRSVAMWGIYKGVCDYFSDTPSPMYNAQYVSDTIPSTMMAGQTYAVSITFRNTGVVWSSARGFHLGAVDDSDPFTASTRLDMASEVGPGGIYTFTFQMTAPAAPGTYATDWRMVRDGFEWFGPVHAEPVQVIGRARGDFDEDDDVDQADFGEFQACLSGVSVPHSPECRKANFDGDSDVDAADFAVFQACMSGPDIPADPMCGPG